MKPAGTKDPAVTSVEVFGFLAWISSAVAYVLYVLWAYTPESVLHRHGITYYPSKYWAIALPTWFCVTIIFIYWVYESLNMIHTLPEIERSSSPLCNTHNGTSTQSVKRYFSRADDEGMLPLVELPPFLVKMVLEDGIPPLEAEEKYLQQVAAASGLVDDIR